MRHYITVDMEGVAGISNWKEMEKDEKRVNELMTAEANAVVEGIIAADPKAEEILVCDSHSAGQNIYPEKLNRKATVVRGIPRNNYMMVGIDKRFDFSYYIGYHSAAGIEKAAMDHTFSGASVRGVKVNGIVVGEFELNAGYAGSYGVGPSLVSGDENFCKSVEAAGLGTLTVTTKIAQTRFCSILYHPEVILDELKEKAEKAVKMGPASFKPLVFKKPYVLTVNLTNSVKADMATLVPDVKRISGTVVEYTAANYPDMYNMFEAIVALARTR